MAKVEDTMNSMKIVYIPTKLLDSSPVQPVWRFAKASLLDSIARRGILSPIEVSQKRGGKYEVIDGHCRAHCARELEIEEVPCIVSVATPSEREARFAETNSTQARMRPEHYFDSWSRSINPAGFGYLKHIPRSAATAIRECVEVFGLDRARQLAAQRVSPGGVAKGSKLIHRWSKEFGAEASLRDAGEWLIEHKSVRFVDQLVRNLRTGVATDNDIKKLLRCLDRNVSPLPVKTKDRA